ncbi:MAG: hypothetical protein ABRQ24_06415 [Syntrophomonadaceae bacterium]
MSIFDKIFESAVKVLAEAEIIGQGDQAYCNFKTPNHVNLIILLAAYFTKIRWYMETEPPVQLERMKRLYTEALDNLPEVKDHCISSCAANGGTMVFRAQVTTIRNENIGLINEMPDALGDRDSTDSCFVLLKAVSEHLDDEERQKLTESLKVLQPVIMEDVMDRTGRGLERAFMTSGVIANLLTKGQWEYL